MNVEEQNPSVLFRPYSNAKKVKSKLKSILILNSRDYVKRFELSFKAHRD